MLLRQSVKTFVKKTFIIDYSLPQIMSSIYNAFYI